MSSLLYPYEISLSISLSDVWSVGGAARDCQPSTVFSMRLSKPPLVYPAAVRALLVQYKFFFFGFIKEKWYDQLRMTDGMSRLPADTYALWDGTIEIDGARDFRGTRKQLPLM